MRGLDEVLGGGLPEYSFNLIAGAPGTGKTTLSQELMFALATPDRPALHFTMVADSDHDALRFEQQFSFAGVRGLSTSFNYVNVSHASLDLGLSVLLDTLVGEVERVTPGLVVVDSFLALVRAAGARDDDMQLQTFLEHLALHLRSWQVTTFLVGDFEQNEMPTNPVISVADGVIWLYESIDRDSTVRKLQVSTMRGQAPLPGLHTLRITKDGLEVLPRMMSRAAGLDRNRQRKCLSTGLAAVDEMLGGGIPLSDSLLVTGPAGSGKSTLARQFIAAGLSRGEPAVIALFKEHPAWSLTHPSRHVPNLEAMVRTGLLEVIYLSPGKLSTDAAVLEIQAAIERTLAQRLVIDSLSDFELALAPGLRDEFPETLYRMVGALTDAGVTVVMTTEVARSFIDLRFSSDMFSFLSDDVIVQRCVEINGHMRKVMNVVKMRAGQYSKAPRLYDLTRTGLAVGETLLDQPGILTGIALH